MNILLYTLINQIVNLNRSQSEFSRKKFAKIDLAEYNNLRIMGVKHLQVLSEILHQVECILKNTIRPNAIHTKPGATYINPKTCSMRTNSNLEAICINPKKRHRVH